jgi:Family of unknown function (DUF5956)
MWSDAQDAEPTASWVELPENGWGALIGWVAGRGNLGRGYIWMIRVPGGHESPEAFLADG